MRSRPTPTCSAVLAHALAAHGGGQLDRALADAGASNVRQCWFKDRGGKPVAGVEGRHLALLTGRLLRGQDPVQADMNLRGTFVSDQDSHRLQRKPAGYPIPVDGRSAILRAQGRHNAPSASAFPSPTGRLQDAGFAGLRAGRQVSGDRRAFGVPAGSSATTCFETAWRPRRHRPVVFARLQLRDESGKLGCRNRRSAPRHAASENSRTGGVRRGRSWRRRYGPRQLPDGTAVAHG